MNFDNNIIPKLVDKKIINYYKSKLKQEPIIVIQEETMITKFCKTLTNNTKLIIINYYGFIILIIAIFILLFVRYKEVYKKKKYINKIIKKYNT
jgi:hypothetical protein